MPRHPHSLALRALPLVALLLAAAAAIPTSRCRRTSGSSISSRQRWRRRSLSTASPGLRDELHVTPSGEAWCWGTNEHGQLGAATTQVCVSGFVPCSWQAVRAAAPMRFASLSPAQLHSCALDTSGQAWCWGFGVGGQLGDGRAVDSRTPVAIAGGHRFVQIDAGRWSLLSCALDDAGAAWCWGPGDSGGLGDGTTNGAKVPVRVLAAQPFVAVGAGDGHACGLDAAGQAWCWGRNAYGKLGLGKPGAALAAGGGRGRSPLRVARGRRPIQLRPHAQPGKPGAGALPAASETASMPTATCPRPSPEDTSSRACRPVTATPAA